MSSHAALDGDVLGKPSKSQGSPSCRGQSGIWVVLSVRSDLWDQAGGGLGPLDLPDPFLNLLVQGGGEFMASWGVRAGRDWRSPALPLLGAGLAWMLDQVAQGWGQSSTGYSQGRTFHNFSVWSECSFFSFLLFFCNPPFEILNGK